MAESFFEREVDYDKPDGKVLREGDWVHVGGPEANFNAGTEGYVFGADGTWVDLSEDDKVFRVIEKVRQVSR